MREKQVVHKLDSIGCYKPIKNNILIRQITDNTVKQVANIDLVFAEKYRVGKDKVRNAIRHGLVYARPEKFMSIKSGRNKTRWDTDLEVEIGDVVWSEHNAFLNAEKIQSEDEMYYMINYQDLIVAKRGEDVIMLNGRVMIEVHEEKEGFLASPFKKKLNWGTVVYNGSDNKSYTNPNLEDSEVKVGDIIYFKPTHAHKLEDDMWRAFGDKDYYYIQKKDILLKDGSL